MSLPGNVPVFPLPDVVFFPGTTLPLHVFEERYRALVRDARDGEGLICVSLLLPGWEEDYHESPRFHDVATVGAIEDLTPLPDGRFALRLVGRQRVILGRVLHEKPYRVVETGPLPEEQVDESAPEVREAKLGLIATRAQLIRELHAPETAGFVLDESLAFETAVNEACAGLPLEPEIRQGLLEEDDLLERCRRVSELQDSVLGKILEARDLVRGGNEPDGLN